MTTSPDPVDTLEAEHVAIERVLDALDQLATQVERDGAAGREQAASLVSFFVDWGDLCHHEKEESLLMPALVRAGVSWEGGELERIVKEHQQERYLIRVLQDAASQQAPWSSEAARHFVSVSRQLTAFLRQHITHERTILFPVVRSRLGSPATRELQARFEQFDRSKERANGTNLEAAARQAVELASGGS